MFETLFRKVTGEQKSDAIEKIIQHASPRPDFFLMIMLAIAMAAMGVITNSVVVLIGSMLIAPMLYPLLSFALGVVISDSEVLGRSFYTILTSVALALGASVVIGIFFTGTDLRSITIVNGSIPSLAYAIVAGIAGFAAAFAMTKQNLNEMLPGVAISVALVPPLAVAGIGLAHLDWAVFVNAFLLFVTNVIGIVLFATVVFSLMGFASKRQVLVQAVKEDEKEIKQETAVSPKSAA